MFSLKLKYQDEVRRVQMPEQVPEDLSFDQLSLTAKTVFPSLVGSQDISFHWTDDENDVISCTSDQEVREALRVLQTAKKTTFKFEVFARNGQSNSGRSSNSAEIHQGVRCNGCGVCPLVGIRFKCAVRDDFDLCQTCEAKDESRFPMLKINSAEQAPLELIVVLKDDEGRSRKYFQGSGSRGPCGPRRFWPNTFGPRGPGPHRGPFGRHHGHGPFGHPHHPRHHRHPHNGPGGPLFEPRHGCDWNSEAKSIFEDLATEFQDALDASAVDVDLHQDQCSSADCAGANACGAAAEGGRAISPLIAMADAFISSLKENEQGNSAPASNSAGVPKCAIRQGGGRCSGGGGQHASSKEDEEEARLVQLALKESTSRSERDIEEDRLIEEALRESMAGEITSASPRPADAGSAAAEASIAVEEVQEPQPHSQYPKPQSAQQHEEASRAMEPAASSVPTDPTAVWARVWAKELQVLADMGFVDTAALLPMLQEHVQVPVSLCSQLNGVPPAEGMQRLLGALLTQSGMLH